ncbi:MAG TPA: 50S ribosomal protein L13, partial [Oligoflexia bacterium]|nr:50S ribosomal protein L13 [Oligoflexia bacterium]
SRKWLLVDADGQPLGRLASKVAAILRGKHNPSFVPHNDTGDFVIVINADKVAMSGKKGENEFYYRHTGFVGGIKRKNRGEVLAKNPEWVVKRAVKGMLPRTSLGRKQLTKLKVYAGADHPHQAQQPQVLN